MNPTVVKAGQQVANMQTRDKLILAGVGVVAIGFAYFGIVKPILNTLGITRDKEERQGDRKEDKLSRQQVLSPLLYRTNKGKVTIPSSKAYSGARDIYAGKGTIWDNESMAVGAITSAGSLVNISYIADAFDKLYGQSMSSYMQSYLEPSNWIEIDNYIDKTKKF